jgi:hypothetical protein
LPPNLCLESQDGTHVTFESQMKMDKCESSGQTRIVSAKRFHELSVVLTPSRVHGYTAKVMCSGKRIGYAGGGGHDKTGDAVSQALRHIGFKPDEGKSYIGMVEDLGLTVERMTGEFGTVAIIKSLQLSKTSVSDKK